MAFESASRITPELSGGDTITGVNRIYGLILKSGSSAGNLIVHKDSVSGAVLTGCYAAANVVTHISYSTPLATECNTLFIEHTAGGQSWLMVNDYDTLTQPTKSLVCRVTVG